MNPESSKLRKRKGRTHEKERSGIKENIMKYKKYQQEKVQVAKRDRSRIRTVCENTLSTKPYIHPFKYSFSRTYIRPF